MSPRTKKQLSQIREDKQELIKTTALKLFAGKGYHATSISQIAEEAAISKGLIYHYYKSKEALLVSLFTDLISLIYSLINPNNDHEITNEEMDAFFDKLIQSMDENKDYWILYYQLSMQPEVLKLMLNQIEHDALALDYTKLLHQYFDERFDDPETEFVLFTSLFKGFCTIYVLNPASVPKEVVPKFLNRMRSMFLHEKKNQNNHSKS